MEIFPSVDIRDGKVVRLVEGDFSKMSVYGGTPEEAAARFASQGARNLHVVDLDGASEGRPVNFDVIKRLCAAAASSPRASCAARGAGDSEPGGAGRLFVQIGGGIRDMSRIEDYLACGAGRVVIGTAAVTNFALVEEAVKKYGDKIAVGVDARDGKAAISAWRDVTGVDAFAFCKRIKDAGVATVIYTDVSRDGRLGGTNLDAYRNLAGLVPMNIVASGGISDESEISELASIGTYGAIVGKALYEGKLSLPRLIAIADGIL